MVNTFSYQCYTNFDFSLYKAAEDDIKCWFYLSPLVLSGGPCGYYQSMQPVAWRSLHVPSSEQILTTLNVCPPGEMKHYLHRGKLECYKDVYNPKTILYREEMKNNSKAIQSTI